MRITIIDSAKVYLLFITFCIYLCWYVNFCFTRFTYILLKLFANLFYFSHSQLCTTMTYVCLQPIRVLDLYSFFSQGTNSIQLLHSCPYLLFAGIINRENTNLSFYSALSILFIYFLKAEEYLSLELRRGRLTFIFVISFYGIIALHSI